MILNILYNLFCFYSIETSTTTRTTQIFQSTAFRPVPGIGMADGEEVPPKFTQPIKSQTPTEGEGASFEANVTGKLHCVK